VGRRRRRARRAAESVVPAEPKRVAKVEQRRRAQYEQERRRLVRQRTVILVLGLIPFVAAVVNLPFGPLDFLGLSPRDGWLMVWAALVGSFLGLTIRLVLERRRFERGAANGRPA
jgi:hypothetical protein